jgi:hypothetical protein
MNVLRDRDCAERHILERRARRKRAAAGGDLDDPVALALREPAQHGIRSSERSDIDGWKCEAIGACPVEHLAVGFVIGDWHGACFGRGASVFVGESGVEIQARAAAVFTASSLLRVNIEPGCKPAFTQCILPPY